MPEALLWTLGAFALILLLARVRVPLSAAIFIGAAVLAVVVGNCGVAGVAGLFWWGTIEPKTVSLMIIVAMLLTLSETMRTAGQLERIVGLARRCLRRPAVSMAAMPVLIGLIPMPGGALFSASMVESAAGEVEVGGSRLSAINYWYRHIWEYWWPLYPAVLLATEQAKIEIGPFAALMGPLTVVMAIAGLWIFRNSHPDLHVSAPRPGKGILRELLRATSSVWLIVVVYVIVKIPVVLVFRGPKDPVSAAACRYLPVSVGLLVSIVWTYRLNRLGWGDLLEVLKGKTVYNMVVLVVAVMVLRYVIAEAGAARRIAGELQHYNVPVLFVLAILPFIAGLVTGLGVGFVGASFPIVLPLVRETIPDYGSMAPYIMLAYAAGHMGMMMSPMHLCHVVSNRYFKTGFAPVYRYMAVPAAMTMAAAVAYFLVLRLILS